MLANPKVGQRVRRIYDGRVGTVVNVDATLATNPSSTHASGPTYIYVTFDGDPDDVQWCGTQIAWEAWEVVEPEPSFACAECGTTKATTYVVTQLDPDDDSTRTEVCRECDDKLRSEIDDIKVAKPTISTLAAEFDMQPYAVAAALDLGTDYDESAELDGTAPAEYREILTVLAATAVTDSQD